MKKTKLSVIDLTENGMGIAKTIDGKVVFIKNGIPCDIVSCNLEPYKKNIWLGENIEYIHYSKSRIEPPCPFFEGQKGDRLCGGCQLQQINYDALLNLKQKNVYEKLERIGDLHLSDIICREIVGMDNPWHYRNHIQLKISFDERSHTFQKGFYGSNSYDLIPHQHCLIALQTEEKIWSYIVKFIQQSKYQEFFRKNWLELIIRHGENTKQLLLAFVLKQDQLTSDITENLRADIANYFEHFLFDMPELDLVSLWLLNEKNRKGDVCIWGQEYFAEILLDKKFHVFPRAFFQVNSKQAEKMFAAVKTVLQANSPASKRGTLFDLYCGTGTIGIVLSEIFEKIKGVEIFPDSILNARENARLNKIDAAEFFVGKAENWLQEQVICQDDVIVVDPPRKGLDPKLMQTLLACPANRLLYISCNPATLARDMKSLSREWTVNFIQPFDLFPWTNINHVETVVFLSKSDADGYL